MKECFKASHSLREPLAGERAGIFRGDLTSNDGVTFADPTRRLACIFAADLTILGEMTIRASSLGPAELT